MTIRKNLQPFDAMQAYVSGQELEYKDRTSNANWKRVAGTVHLASLINASYAIRIKHDTIMVNGFEINAPIKDKSVMWDGQEFFCPSLIDVCLYSSYQFSKLVPDYWFSRGIVFLQKEHAIAMTRALLGYDPSSSILGDCYEHS